MNKNLIVSTYRLISVFLIIVGNPNMSAIGFQMHMKLYAYHYQAYYNIKVKGPLP